MNRVQRFFANRLLGVKGLYDLHPELYDRQPIMRMWSDDDQLQDPGFQSAADSYNTHIWTHKAVKVIADGFAQLGIRVVGGEDEEEAVGHPVTALYEYANEVMSQSDLWREWTVNMLLGGECAQELVRRGRDNGPYAEVWNRNADQVTVRVNKAQKHYGGITGYRIDFGTNDWYDVPPEELVFHKFYNPQNRWRGIAPIHAVRMGILIDEFAQAWSRLLFKNAVRPDIIVLAPQGLAQREREELEAKLSKRYAGIDNAHRPIVLEEGVMDVKPISYPPKDTQWLEQRKFARDEVAAVFGVPDEMMGYGRDTYENFGQALRVLWSMTLVPLIRLRDDKLTTFFRNVQMIQSDQKVSTDLSQVDALQEDKDKLTERAMRMVEKGWPLNLVNEVFSLGLGEVEGGDYGYMPLSMVPVTRIPGTPEPESSDGDVSGSDDSEPPSEEPDEEEPEEPTARSSNRKALGDFGSLEHRHLYLLAKAKLDPGEARFGRMAKKMFQREQDEVNEIVRAAGDVGALANRVLYDPVYWRDQWQETFRPIVADTMVDGGQHILDLLSARRAAKQDEGALFLMDFALDFPEAQQVLDTVLWSFAKEVGQTTQDHILNLFDIAMAEGWTVPKLSEELGNLYAGFKGPRAELVARTETTKSFNAGSHLAYVTSNVAKRGWLATLDDDRVRDAHLDAHGQTRTIQQPFDVGGEQLMYPGDPAGSAANICNCRCTTYPVIEV